MQHTLIILSSLIVLLAYLVYEWSIFHGTTRPHRTTRFVLMLITILGSSALFAESDRVVFWLIAMMAVNSIILFLISLKYGVGGWAKSDVICLIIALVGITSWKLTSNPAFGLYAAVVADFAGMIPTVIKTYRHPETEYSLWFLLDVVSIILILIALPRWELIVVLYPLYLLIINSILLILTQRPKFRRYVAGS